MVQQIFTYILCLFSLYTGYFECLTYVNKICDPFFLWKTTIYT